MPLLLVAQTVLSEESVPGTVAGSTLMFTTAELLEQGLFAIVHLNWYVPAVRPVTVVLYCEALLNEAVFGPDTCVQVPVPVTGLLPDSVADVVLHNV